MNNTVSTRTLLLVAVGMAAVAPQDRAEASQEQCQLKDPESQAGGEVTMSKAQLQAAQQHPNGDWEVHVSPSNLAGITVPAGMTDVKVRLTNAQRNMAVQYVQPAAVQTVTFSVHSEEWVEQQEQRLLGGFAVNFNGPVCPYNTPWAGNY